MLKEIIRKTSNPSVPVFNEVSFDVNGKIGTLVPQRVIDYPEVDLFDVDVLQANGVSPEMVSSPLISSSLEETDATLDLINQKLDEN